MIPAPSFGIKGLLIGASVGVNTTTDDWSIHISKSPVSPKKVIVIYDTGGKPSNPQWLVNYPSVQIKVRGGKNDYEAVYVKCVEIVDTLLGLPSQDIDGNRWVSISQMGGINFLGYDENGYPSFSMNYSLIIEPADNAATHRESL